MCLAYLQWHQQGCGQKRTRGFDAPHDVQQRLALGARVVPAREQLHVRHEVLALVRHQTLGVHDPEPRRRLLRRKTVLHHALGDHGRDAHAGGARAENNNALVLDRGGREALRRERAVDARERRARRALHAHVVFAADVQVPEQAAWLQGVHRHTTAGTLTQPETCQKCMAASTRLCRL